MEDYMETVEDLICEFVQDSSLERYMQAQALEKFLKEYREIEIRNDELNKAIGKEYELGKAQAEYEVNEAWKYKINKKIEKIDNKLQNENNNKVVVWLCKQRKVLQELLEKE